MSASSACACERAAVTEKPIEKATERVLKRLGGVMLAVALCVGTAAAVQKKAASATKPSAGSVKAESVPAESRTLIVYYFHGGSRCFTCKKIESLTKAVMDERFAPEVEKGRVEYRVVNVDEKGNRHYIEDYQLYSKSVVISDVVDGTQTRWKNLEQLWEKVRDEDAFRKYIEDEVRAYLGGA